MKKKELLNNLREGKTMGTLFTFTVGQCCRIFKAEQFTPGDEILYIPDLELNEIPLDRPLTDAEERADVLCRCYTGDDFLDICGGDLPLAERLFHYCDWQHPTSALHEVRD